jgi:hypothetical protein
MRRVLEEEAGYIKEILSFSNNVVLSHSSRIFCEAQWP